MRLIQKEKRAEFRRQLGLDNASWRVAGPLSSILEQLNRPEAVEGDFKYANILLLNRFFGRHYGKVEVEGQRWALEMDHRPTKYSASSVYTIRTLQTNGYNWTIKTPDRKSSVHRLDIRQPQARQCLFDIIHPIDHPQRPTYQRHLRSLTATQLNGTLQTPKSQATKNRNGLPKLEGAAVSRQYNMDPPPRLKD